MAAPPGGDAPRHTRSPRWMTIAVTVVTAVLAAVACSADGAGHPATPAPSPAGGPALAWQGCGSGLECATLAVPVDPDQPGDATVELAVARRPAAEPARRMGSIVVNPGGPGASGIDLLRVGVPGEDRLGRFDIVSWDPRGVGQSRPLNCDGGVAAYRALDWTPDTPAEAAALDEGARRIAETCRRAAGDLVDHLATEDTVEDLDRLRSALDEEQLTYLGFSYGTAVGLRYLARHPERVRAMVLDGVSDPRDDLVTALAGQAEALDAHISATLGGSVATYDKVLAAAEAGTGPLDPTTVAVGAIAASYQPDGASVLAMALTEADRGDGGALAELATRYWSSGAYGPYLAVVCSDQAHDEGSAALDAIVAELAARAPRFGIAAANEMRPCAWWPATSPPPGPIGAPTAPAVLVLGNTGDVATPYHSAVRIAEDLDRGALVTLVGRGHTSLGHSACVGEHVRRYLEGLAVPPVGTRCS